VSDDNYEAQRITSATFLIEVDGVEIGRFMEVSGLEVSISVEEIPEGGENNYVHKVPGRMTFPNIVLKRGVTQSDKLLTWLTKSAGEQFEANSNKLTRSTAAITLIGPTANRLRSWSFDGAFPVKWTGPQFAVDSTNPAIEELEIAHNGFRAETLA
jgi:phage tail-like protein